MLPWNNVFEYFRDRGRGALFFGGFSLVLGLLIGGIILGQFLGEEKSKQCVEWMFLLIGIICMARVCLAIRRVRARRLNRYKISPLSRDEISKARSKLMGRQSSGLRRA